MSGKTITFYECEYLEEISGVNDIREWINDNTEGCVKGIKQIFITGGNPIEDQLIKAIMDNNLVTEDLYSERSDIELSIYINTDW